MAEFKKRMIGVVLAIISLILILLVYVSWSVEGEVVFGLPFSIIAMYFIMLVGLVFGFIYYFQTTKT
jgi:hypothetical protein